MSASNQPLTTAPTQRAASALTASYAGVVAATASYARVAAVAKSMTKHTATNALTKSAAALASMVKTSHQTPSTETHAAQLVRQAAQTRHETFENSTSYRTAMAMALEHKSQKARCYPGSSSGSIRELADTPPMAMIYAAPLTLLLDLLAALRSWLLLRRLPDIPGELCPACSAPHMLTIAPGAPNVAALV